MTDKFSIIHDLTDIRPVTRPFDTVFIHCSASDYSEHDSAKVIDNWHRARGFSEIGYHFFIRRDGEIQAGRSLEKMPAAQKGYNLNTVAICVHGLTKDRFKQEQKTALLALCLRLNNLKDNSLIFRGHCEVEKGKTCPVFDYKDWLKLDHHGRMRIST